MRMTGTAVRSLVDKALEPIIAGPGQAIDIDMGPKNALMSIYYSIDL